MAKDNLFLGMARGKVGDVVFSRLNGVQVSRARNRAPHNPQSPAQMVQRIIMSTVGKAYSFMQPICDHSFEGFETGQLSQRKFMEVNVGIMRDSVADVLAYPVEEVVKASTAYNFSYKNEYQPVINRYMLSAGSLPSIQLFSDGDVVLPSIPLDNTELTTATLTYADVIRCLGCQRGDQITFIQATHDNTKTGHERDLMTGFRFARVILEPASGDLTAKFIGTGDTINDPNERNEGGFSGLYVQTRAETTVLTFYLDSVSSLSESDKHCAASAIILSRQVGGKWRRSQQFLEPTYRSGESMFKNSTLGVAYETYRMGSASDLYLNQAE